MRTAVVRVFVDPDGGLGVDDANEGVGRLRNLASSAGIGVNAHDLAAAAPTRREVQLLVAGSDRDSVENDAIELCRRAFGTDPRVGVVTYVSRGTDDDAHGVLAGFGLTGDIARTAGADGLDVVYVTLAKADLDRVPESRIHTALEASLNSEVHIVTV